MWTPRRPRCRRRPRPHSDPSPPRRSLVTHGGLENPSRTHMLRGSRVSSCTNDHGSFLSEQLSKSVPLPLPPRRRNPPPPKADGGACRPCFEFHPAGHLLAAGMADGGAVVWGRPLPPHALNVFVHEYHPNICPPPHTHPLGGSGRPRVRGGGGALWVRGRGGFHRPQHLPPAARVPPVVACVLPFPTTSRDTEANRPVVFMWALPPSFYPPESLHGPLPGIIAEIILVMRPLVLNGPQSALRPAR